MFCGPSKDFNNISWPINICLKYFMAPTKTLRPPSYIRNVRPLTTPPNCNSLVNKLAKSVKYFKTKLNTKGWTCALLLH